LKTYLQKLSKSGRGLYLQHS